MIVVRRMIPGIGDAIMMEPTIRWLSYCDDVAVMTRYPALYEGMYNIVNEPPDGASVVNLDNPCPAALYESQGDIRKGRVQLFMESTGLKYDNDAPEVFIPEHEIEKHEGVNIGLATVSANYGNALDGFRDYPYHGALSHYLSRYGAVHWLHTEPCGYETLWKRRSLRELLGFVAGLDLVVSVDTAAAHIAGALGVKVLGLFGPTDPRLRIANYPSAFWIPMYEKCGLAYCWYNPCPKRYCLTTLKPKHIAERAKALLNE